MINLEAIELTGRGYLRVHPRSLDADMDGVATTA
jgi:hypothetical protein